MMTAATTRREEKNEKVKISLVTYVSFSKALCALGELSPESAFSFPPRLLNYNRLQNQKPEEGLNLCCGARTISCNSINMREN